MAQAIMREAVDKEDFKLWDRGEPIPKKQPEPHEDPKPIKAEVLELDKVDIGKITGSPQGRRKAMKNDEGVSFMGFDVSLTFSGTKKPMAGWMTEADYIVLKHELVFADELNIMNME